MPGVVGGIQRATLRATSFASCKGWSGLSFGHVRKRLREFAGLSPSFPAVDRAGRRQDPDRPVADRWAERRAVWSNSPTWRYLRRKRGLSAAIIEAASVAGVLREGPVGSAWFAHFDRAEAVAHVG